MPAAPPTITPAPPALLLRLGEHLDRQQFLLDQLATLIGRMGDRFAAGGGIPTNWDDELQQLAAQSTRLQTERTLLDESLQQHCRSTSVRLSQLVLRDEDRRRLENHRRRLRAAAARTAGLLRGTISALNIWGDVLQEAMEAALGAPAREITYTNRGQQPPGSSAVLMETRS